MKNLDEIYNALGYEGESIFENRVMRNTHPNTQPCINNFEKLKDEFDSFTIDTDEKIVKDWIVRVLDGYRWENRDQSYFDPHYRFDMSGYSIDGTLECDFNNQQIIRRFGMFGIFKKLAFINIIAYKGSIGYVYCPWDEFALGTGMSYFHQFHFCGEGTIDIIYHMIKSVHWELEGRSTRRTS